MTPNGYLSKKILLVDDDESIISLIDTVLHKEGYSRIYTAGSGKEAIQMVNETEPDLIVLDVMLPDFDGYEICRQIRDKSMVPIIFLSAKSDESDKLISYAMGGDEYITKPFSPKMLLAKISAMLKRQSYYDDKGANDNRYVFGSFALDFEKKLLFKDGEEVFLTAKEYALLEFLIINRNIIALVLLIEINCLLSVLLFPDSENCGNASCCNNCSADSDAEIPVCGFIL